MNRSLKVALLSVALMACLVVVAGASNPTPPMSWMWAVFALLSGMVMPGVTAVLAIGELVAEPQRRAQSAAAAAIGCMLLLCSALLVWLWNQIASH